MHLPSGTKRVITLPAIAMVFALLAAPVHAQHVVTTNEMYPITGPYDYTPPVPCGCSGPSDAVNLRGVIHMMVQAEPGPTGIVTMQGNLIGVVGTSPTTGCTYHAVGSARLSSHPPGPTPFLGTYALIRPPSCDPPTVAVTGEVFINTDGTQNPAFSMFVIGNP